VKRVSPAFVFGGLLGASTINYNLTLDWLNNSNPNGVWSYDQGSTPLPFQGSLGTGSCFSGAPGVTAGYAPGIDVGGCLPAMFKATGNASNVLDYQTGDIVVHSQDNTNGPGEGQATIVWTAPVSGTFTFTGAVWYAHSGVTRSNDFALDLGATTLASGTVTNGINRSTPDAFASSGSIVVLAGQQVDLIIQRSAGQTLGSFAGVQLDITETSLPEPSTALLSLTFLAAAGIWRKRR